MTDALTVQLLTQVEALTASLKEDLKAPYTEYRERLVQQTQALAELTAKLKLLRMIEVEQQSTYTITQDIISRLTHAIEPDTPLNEYHAILSKAIRELFLVNYKAGYAATNYGMPVPSALYEIKDSDEFENMHIFARMFALDYLSTP